MRTVLLVDGYNVLNAWPELKVLLDTDFDGAREKLNDFMIEYSTYYGEVVYVVYDAYLTNSKIEKIESVGNVHIVYTKENQTADAFIEKKVRELSADVRLLIKVATSDWVQQRQVLGSGGIRLTPYELKEKCMRIRKRVERQYQMSKDSTIESRLGEGSFSKLKDLLKEIKE
jgi:predicted RNA-binding protein with PIN domain